MALVHLLSKSLVKDVPRPKGGVVTVKSSDNPRAAYKKLNDNNIHSAPVFDVREASPPTPTPRSFPLLHEAAIGHDHAVFYCGQMWAVMLSSAKP